MSNHVKTKITQVAGVHLFELKDSGSIDGLPAAKYVPFDENLEYAGLSHRGIMLSKPKSQGPASVDGYLIKKEPPKGWFELYSNDILYPINTQKPELLLTKASWGSFDIWMNPANLYQRTKYSEDAAKEFKSYTLLDVKLTTAIIQLHARLQDTLFVIDSNCLKLAVPAKAVLNATDWLTLNRYVFTGASTATFKDTVEINDGFGFVIPVRTVSEAESRFGIIGTPNGKENKGLVFREITIQDATKASAYKPVLQHLQGKTLQLDNATGYHEKTANLQDLLKTPEILSKRIVITENFTRVLIKEDLEQNTKTLKAPVIAKTNCYETECIVCPESLVSEYLVATRSGARQMKIPSSAKRRFLFHTFKLDKKTGGTWLLKTEIEGSKPRDLKEEATERENRKLRLEQQYGELPDNWRELSDEDIQSYFSLKAQVTRGELVAIDKHPLVPENHGQDFENWLNEPAVIKQAGKCVFECPISKTTYIRNFTTFDEIAALPRFWEFVVEMFDENEWLQKMVGCKTVQALALSELF